jgi:hypothetical protein
MHVALNNNNIILKIVGFTGPVVPAPTPGMSPLKKFGKDSLKEIPLGYALLQKSKRKTPKFARTTKRHIRNSSIEGTTGNM